MTADYSTDELRRRCEGARLRTTDHLNEALDDVIDAINYAPAPMTRDQFGMVEIKLREARELVALIVP
jgi:hypothetical protein